MAQDKKTNPKKTSVKSLRGLSGRLNESMAPLLKLASASIDYDTRLYAEDIEASLVHAHMLKKIGVLSATELKQIEAGLKRIRQQIEQGNFEWQIELEDVHMNIEAALVKDIGEAGRKLHTGRSRNDQVATDMRLYLRHKSRELAYLLRQLQQELLTIALREASTLMPGFTHLQPAQAISFGHHMMAWFEMLERDHERLLDCCMRLNSSPLGAAALAGSSFPLDRAFCAKELGFTMLCENSLDAVSDRDFIMEFCAFASITMIHLSRFAEEMILWVSPAFGFIELPDNLCTSSSIMPQKKNPDLAELVRGRCGRVTGNLMALFMLMKAQPLAYNRDNQEDKERLFDSVDTLHQSLLVFTTLVNNMQVKGTAMLLACQQGYLTATDLADYLVRQGVAFRDAHHAAGLAVRLAIEEEKQLHELTLEQLQSIDECIKEDVYQVLSIEGSVAARNHLGGTAPQQVKEAVERAKQRLANRNFDSQFGDNE